MKYLLFLLLAGCTTTLTHWSTFDPNAINCAMGKPFYLEMYTVTDLQTEQQKTDIYWLCVGKQGKRHLEVYTNKSE